MTIARSIARSVAKPVAKKVTGGSSGGGALDIRASVGTSTSPTSTGTKAVTGVGFTPKLNLALTVESSSTGSDCVFGLGACTGPSAMANIAVASQNGQTTSNARRKHSAAASISSINPSGATTIEAALSSFDADGLTRNWSAAQAGTRLLNEIFLGGADLEVSLVQGIMNATNAAQSIAHGLTEAPTGGIGFFAANSAAPANTASTLKLGIGAFAGTSQFGASIYSNSGVTTTEARRLLSTSHLMADLTTSVQRSIALSSVDSTNVNLSFPNTSVATQYYFWLLLFRGAKCQVGTFDCNGSTSPLTIATTGITPKLFLPVMVPGGVDFAGTANGNLALTIGASDGTNNVSCGITDIDNATTTNARRFQSSTKLIEHWVDGIKYFEATAAFSGESVVLTPTTNNNSLFGQGGYLILGS